jgi:hypothetical protein
MLCPSLGEIVTYSGIIVMHPSQRIRSEPISGLTREPSEVIPSVLIHSVEYIELVKTLKGIFPNLILSTVMAVLLNFRPIPMYLPKKLNYGIST